MPEWLKGWSAKPLTRVRFPAAPPNPMNKLPDALMFLCGSLCLGVFVAGLSGYSASTNGRAKATIAAFCVAIVCALSSACLTK